MATEGATPAPSGPGSLAPNPPGPPVPQAPNPPAPPLQGPYRVPCRAPVRGPYREVPGGRLEVLGCPWLSLGVPGCPWGSMGAPGFPGRRGRLGAPGMGGRQGWGEGGRGPDPRPRLSHPMATGAASQDPARGPARGVQEPSQSPGPMESSVMRVNGTWPREATRGISWSMTVWIAGGSRPNAWVRPPRARGPSLWAQKAHAVLDFGALGPKRRRQY